MYTSGKLVALFIFSNTSTKSGQSAPLPAAVVISGSATQLETDNVFGAEKFSNKKDETKKVAKKKTKKKKKDLSLCTTSKKKSGLKYKVQSITLMQNPIKSMVTIKIKKQLEGFRQNESLESDAIVGVIESDKVHLRNIKTGNCEYLSVPQPKGRKKLTALKVHPAKDADKFKKGNDRITNEGNSFKIKKSLRDELLSGGMSDLISQAKGIPIQNSDGTISFKIVDVVPGSLYSNLNIQDNDIIKGINGKPVTSLNEVTSLFGRIKDLNNLSLTIERNGTEVEQDYSFE